MKCQHPPDRIVQFAPTLRRCNACGAYSGTIDMWQYYDMIYPPGVPHEVVSKGAPWRPEIPRLSKDWRK